MIGALNSILLDKQIFRNIEKHTGILMVESMLCYGPEVSTINANLKRGLNSLDLDYLKFAQITGSIRFSNNIADLTGLF